jgi:hypothetical protein
MMENAALLVRYAWTLISEYRKFKASDDAKEAQLAGLMIDGLIKFLTDYITPPVDTPQ